ncbi:uncharacterized protein LOC143257676 [Tachypleus tridentatus]|uniref:uncharacterized protein LOC143257676 n=1 Tax=Tachypleus tridentatus TaxID=6853 RepID=UPI003FD033AF
MAMLQRIQSGWVRDGWREAAPHLHDKPPTFVYVPGHAGVKYNDKADQVAAAAEPMDQIYIKGLDKCYRKQLITGNISRSALDLLLTGRVKAERICDSLDTPPECPPANPSFNTITNDVDFFHLCWISPDDNLRKLDPCWADTAAKFVCSGSITTVSVPYMDYSPIFKTRIRDSYQSTWSEQREKQAFSEKACYWTLDLVSIPHWQSGMIANLQSTPVYTTRNNHVASRKRWSFGAPNRPAQGMFSQVSINRDRFFRNVEELRDKCSQIFKDVRNRLFFIFKLIRDRLTQARLGLCDRYTRVFQKFDDRLSIVKNSRNISQRFEFRQLKRVISPYMFAYPFRIAKAVIISLVCISVLLITSSSFLSSEPNVRIEKSAPSEENESRLIANLMTPQPPPPQVEPEISVKSNWIGVQEPESWTDNWININADLDVYSAYFDKRASLREGPVIRIIGKTERKPTILAAYIECWVKLISSEGEENILKIKMRDLDIDKLHNSCILKCSHGDFTTNVPTHVGVKLTSSSEDPTWIKIHQIPQPKMDSEINIAVCVLPFSGPMNKTQLLAEFIAFYSVLGVRHFSFYDYDTTTSFRRLLDVIAQSEDMSVDILPWKLTWEKSDDSDKKAGSSFAYFSGFQDCGYRHMHHYSHVLFLDIDNFLTPSSRNHTTLVELIQNLDASENGLCCDIYRFTQAIFCLKFPSFVSPYPNTSNFITFAKRIARPAIVLSSHWPGFFRYFVRPEKAYMFGPHDSFMLPQTTRKSMAKPALIHHYLDLQVCDFNKERQKVIYVDLIPYLYGKEMLKIVTPWIHYI